MMALLPLLIFAGLALAEAVGAYRQAEEARLRDTARALAAAIDEQIGASVQALRGFATSPIFDGSLDVERIEARARSFGETLGGWILLVGAGPDHRPIANSLRRPDRSVPTQRPPQVVEASRSAIDNVFGRGEPGVTDVFPAPLRDQPVFLTMVPVIRDGEVRYGLALGRTAASMDALLARQDLPAGTFAAVADSRLRVLADTRDRQVGRATLGRPAPGWMADAMAGRDRRIVTGAGEDGAQTVYALERLANAPGWTVLVGQPVAAQQAAAWRALRLLLLGAAALALGLAAVAWTSRREALRDALREAQALRAGREEVERLHGGLPVLVFLRDVAPDGTSRLIYRGGDLRGVTGWPAEEIARHQDLTVFADQLPEVFADFLRRVLRDGQASIEWRFRQPDGSARQVVQRARLLARRADGSGEVVGYLLDVTSQRAAEARAVAAGRLAALGEMSAGLAHELRQPLQAISLAVENAQIAAERYADDELDRRLLRIAAQTERAAQVIEHLRRFARGAEEAAPLEPIGLGRLVEETLMIAGGALRQAGITVETDLGDPAPVVRGHLVPLEQVLTNLLLNARDALAARPAGTPRRIRIAARLSAGGVARLSVSDTGGGIAPAVLRRLFEPFVTTKSAENGTGLGLSICHGLAQAMGGTLEGTNDAQGAVFTLTLPVWSEAGRVEQRAAAE